MLECLAVRTNALLDHPSTGLHRLAMEFDCGRLIRVNNLFKTTSAQVA